MTIRPAIQDDAAYIAESVFRAFLIDLDTFSAEQRRHLLTQMTDVCRRTDTFYSWTNTLVAVLDNHPVGILISYDASRYRAMRNTTFPLLRAFMTPLWGEDFDQMDDEAGEGDYYLDTLAVSPTHRHQGIGTALLRQSLATAQSLCLSALLAVDPVNTKAQRLYTSLGFVPLQRKHIFGDEYIMMTKK